MHLVIQGFEICLIYFLLSCCLIGKFLSIILESLEKKETKSIFTSLVYEQTPKQLI